MSDNVSDEASSNKSRRWFDEAEINKTLSLVGLIYSWLVSTAFLVLGTVNQLNPFLRTVPLTGVGREALVLLVNVLITFCNEATYWIHMVTLRWTLCKEGRLAFNSNLFILDGARTSPSNSWWSNVIMLIGVTMTYSSASLVFLTGIEDDDGDNDDLGHGKEVVVVCGQAMITLGFGVLLQVAMATWNLSVVEDIPTWSIDPLDTAAAAEFHAASHARRPNRCLLGVDKTGSPALPTHASETQVSLYATQKHARRIIWLIWFSVGLSTVWGIIAMLIIAIGNGDDISFGSDWFFLPSDSTPELNIGWYDGDTLLPTRVFAWCFCLISIAQAILTVVLQAASLLVNASRDESFWRTIARPKGKPREPPNIAIYVLGSWQYVGLLVFKPLLHWLYGLAITIEFSKGVYMRPPQIMYLTIGAALFGVFMTILARRKPQGPLPATYGHLQTIIDIIDYWSPLKDEMMYWGHKEDPSKENGWVAHAGISSKPLPSIRMDCLYAGLKKHD